jgi:hypothetical protein
MESNYYEHERQVREFLEACEREDGDRYRAVCAKYPVLSASKRKAVRRKETSVGLLGLCPSRISIAVGARNGVESIYQDDQ